MITVIVMKRFDNIVRVFAVAGALVLSSMASIFLYDFVLTPYFIAGSVVIIGATFLYLQL